MFVERNVLLKLQISITQSRHLLLSKVRVSAKKAKQNRKSLLLQPLQQVIPVPDIKSFFYM